MKLRTFFSMGVVGLLFLAACNEDYPELEVSQSNEDKVESVVPAMSEDRSVVTKTNVDNIIAKMRGNAKTRAAYSQDYTIQALNGKSGKPYAYVVNFKNNGGYVLISASKRYYPILAYSETGNFNIEHNIGALKEWENTINSEIEKSETLPMDSVRKYMMQWGEYEPKTVPTTYRQSRSGSLPHDEFLELQAVVMDSVMAWWTKGYEVYGITDCPYLDETQTAQLKEAIIGGMYPLYMDYWNEFTRIVKKEKVISSNVDNFVYSTWGQGAGYNQFYPILSGGSRADAGCGPVAAGQIMYYFRHPNTYNWDAMELHIPTTETARLLYDIAEMADASYGLNGTGTTIKKIKSTFEDLGYSLQLHDDDFINPIMESCDQHKPVYTRGTSNEGEGHAWVISGYHLEDVETYFEVWTFMRSNSFAVFDRMFPERVAYYNFYMNMGWGGSLNGYYYMPPTYINDRKYLCNITPNR